MSARLRPQRGCTCDRNVSSAKYGEAEYSSGSHNGQPVVVEVNRIVHALRNLAGRRASAGLGEGYRRARCARASCFIFLSLFVSNSGCQ